MKHKFNITKHSDTKDLTITEMAELDKGEFVVVCTETYESKIIKNVVKKDNRALIDVLRTENFFPVKACIHRIADSVQKIYSSRAESSCEVSFNDSELLGTIPEAIVEEAPAPETDDKEMADSDIDDILDDVPDTAEDTDVTP